MKFLPVNKSTRVSTEDSLGHGMDAVIMLALFLLAGFGLDRLFGTMPIFMIVMTLLGSIGLFFKFKYSYDARMDELDAQRRGPAAAGTAPDTAPVMPITPSSKVPSSVVPSSFRSTSGNAPNRVGRDAGAEQTS